MGLINLEEREKQAIVAIDIRKLEKAIDETITHEGQGVVDEIHLRECGDFVSKNLRRFNRDLADHQKAKTAKKREETLYSLRKAGRNLVYSVQDMKRHVEDEEREGQLFSVFDPSFSALSPDENMQVRVSYRWRQKPEDEWCYGSIVFKRVFRPRYDPYAYKLPKPKRKPSARQLAEERDNERREQYKHLEQVAHDSVRDYFRAGHGGADIPDEFEIKVDERGQMNNFSADFWPRNRGS